MGVKISELEQAWENVKQSLPFKNQDGIIIQEFIPGEYSGITFIDNNIENEGGEDIGDAIGNLSLLKELELNLNNVKGWCSNEIGDIGW